MEFSGDDDQVNSAGAYSTGSGLQQQQQEWSNQTPLPDDQTRARLVESNTCTESSL